jgi:hypothetical protein
MNSFFIFQFADFANSNPNWFEWFSLAISSLISILSVWGGFWIAKRIYSKERNDKILEENEIQESEVRLFKNSLSQLNSSLQQQINALENYLSEQDFSLDFYQGVQVDFLQFINIKYLYKDIGVTNQDKLKKVNSLLSSLYTLSDFRISLRDELRTFMKKYGFHEDKFYSYRKVLYTKYFELCNLRSNDFKTQGGIQTWQFSADDRFMIEYSKLRDQIFNDKEVISENGLKDRKLFVERFIIPLVSLSSEFLPGDYNAIEVNDIANDIYSAFNDIEHVTLTHKQAAKSYVDILKGTKEQIEGYLN